MLNVQRPESENENSTMNHVPEYNWKEREMTGEGRYRPHCAVCKLESNLWARAKYGKCPSRSQRALAFCAECGIYGHTSVNENSKFQEIPELRGKSCYDIIHSDFCNGLWNNSGKRRTVSTKHHVYDLLLAKYDIPKKKGSKSKNGKV